MEQQRPKRCFEAHKLAVKNMPVDLVYPLNERCSHWRNQELRYSLRSVEKYMKNFRNVYLIGDMPPYLDNHIIHIPHEDDITHCKERRIMEKFLHACSVPDVSNPFVMMNDDYFLIKEIDAENLPYYHRGELLTLISSRKEGIYKRSLINTYDVLSAAGLESRHFDIHYPMYYDKGKFPKVMTKYDWNIRAGYVVKSLYANSLGIEGEYRRDCKIMKSHDKADVLKRIEGFDLFSTAEMSRAIINVINERFPKESVFEK